MRKTLHLCDHSQCPAELGDVRCRPGDYWEISCAPDIPWRRIRGPDFGGPTEYQRLTVNDATSHVRS